MSIFVSENYKFASSQNLTFIPDPQQSMALRDTASPQLSLQATEIDFLIGGVNIRQDVSPRQGRPGGHNMLTAVTFSKIS